MLEKNDNFKQRRINEIFSAAPKSFQVDDVEDFGKTKNPLQRTVAVVNKRKREKEAVYSEEELNKTWREVLGNPPKLGKTLVS